MTRSCVGMFGKPRHTITAADFVREDLSAPQTCATGACRSAHAAPETKAVPVPISDTFVVRSWAARRTVPSPTPSSLAISPGVSLFAQRGNLSEIHTDLLPSQRTAPVPSLRREPASLLQFILPPIETSLHALANELLLKFGHGSEQLSNGFHVANAESHGDGQSGLVNRIGIGLALIRNSRAHIYSPGARVCLGFRRSQSLVRFFGQLDGRG